MKATVKAKKSGTTQKVIVDLDAAEKRALQLQARRCGISTTELVRTVVNQYFAIGR